MMSRLLADDVPLGGSSGKDVGIRRTGQGLHRQLYRQGQRGRSYRVYDSILIPCPITPKLPFHSFHCQVQGVSGAAFTH